MVATDASDNDFPPDQYAVSGYETITKDVTVGGGAGHALVPKTWLGDRVKVIRLTHGTDRPLSPITQDNAGRYIVPGYSLVDKQVGPVGAGAHIYVPKEWVGDRVQIVRVSDNHGPPSDATNETTAQSKNETARDAWSFRAFTEQSSYR